MAKTSDKKSNSNTAPQKNKRKSPKRNYRQLVISTLVGLALIAFILPDILPLLTGGSSNRAGGTIPPSSNSDSPPPSTMPEPSFTKEGELSIIKSETGETIKHIDIEKADNDMERAFGMMYRKSVSDSQGMLFLFEQSKPQSFWMKNTLIPLDIIYIDEDHKITTIYPNTTPLSESSLPSNGSAKYVLEVRGGFCQDYGVKIGDSIEWE